jgi:hypothetical protein
VLSSHLNGLKARTNCHCDNACAGLLLVHAAGSRQLPRVPALMEQLAGAAMRDTEEQTEATKVLMEIAMVHISDLPCGCC